MTISLWDGLQRHRQIMRACPPEDLTGKFALSAFAPPAPEPPFMTSPSADPRLTPYIPIAIATHDRYFPRGPFISIQIAMGIIESDWFTRPSGKNNFFGIKANSAQIAAGTYTTRSTHEVINGREISIHAEFADYPDTAACFDAHAHLLTSPHYYRCVHALNPNAYAQALQDCGYATAPNYATSLINLMAAHDLYSLDALGLTTRKIAMGMPHPKPADTSETLLDRLEAYIESIFHRGA